MAKIIGNTTSNRSTDNQALPNPPISSIVPIIPTSPLVPIPAPAGLHLTANKHVPIGPKIALTIIVGNHTIGFFTIFLNCNILVPIPTDITVPTPLSFLLITAKPNI